MSLAAAPKAWSAYSGVECGENLGLGGCSHPKKPDYCLLFKIHGLPTYARDLYLHTISISHILLLFSYQQSGVNALFLLGRIQVIRMV